MRPLRLAALSFISLLIAGCSGPFLSWESPEPPAPSIEEVAERLGEPVFTLTGWGTLNFLCTKDAEGRYWRLVHSDVMLTDSRPGSRRALVRQLQDFSFVSRDGSMLRAEVELWQSGATTGDLKTILFKTRPGGNKGRLSGIMHVIRDEARGGQPQTACRASKTGRERSIPFTARYRFYRN
jgi:hypothetical protein